MSLHWDLYWQNSVTGSFGEQQPLWYKKEIIPIWKGAFSKLPEQSTLLDVATGNGAVTSIATEYAQDTKKRWEIQAVDSAKTQPQSGIKLLPPCPLEKIELEQEKYELISAQFGLEYSRVSQSLPKLANSLKPGGSLIVIAHHTNSILSKNSREEIDQYRSCFQQNSIFERLKKLIQKMGEIRSPHDLQKIKDTVSKQRQALNLSVARLTTQFPQGIVIADLLKNIEPLFNNGMYWPLPAKLEYIENLQQQMKQARQRLTDQVSSALTQKDVEEWEKLTTTNGLTLSQKQTIEAGDNNILAWHLLFTK
jgi:ubiquinone/menaquinone biosynthesis C-methylase UbiE